MRVNRSLSRKHLCSNQGTNNSSKSAWRTFSCTKLEILRCRDAELRLNLDEARTTNRKHMTTESFSSSSSMTSRVPWVPEVCLARFPVSVNRDFKQREPQPQRVRQSLRENPNNQLRMTGGKNSDVLRSAPT